MFFSQKPLCIDCGNNPKANRQSRCSDCLRVYKNRLKSAKTVKRPVVKRKLVEPMGQNQSEMPRPDVWSEKRMVSTLAPVKVKVEAPDDIELLFKKVANVQGAHFSVSMARDGRCRLQSHGNPQKTYKGENLLEVLQAATRV